MIQRKQSLWLFIAALLNAGVFYFDLYRYHTITHTMVEGVDSLTDTPGQLRISDHYPSLLIALVMTLLPLVTIFMYKARKRQLKMSFVSLLAIISFVSMFLQRINQLTKLPTPPTNETYWIGAVLPVAAFIFVILAMLGIRKDDKMVRSADRLR